MKIPVYILLICSATWAQVPGGVAGSHSTSASPATTLAAPTDTQNVSEMVQQLRAASEKSDADLTRLRVEKWKIDAAGKQQAAGISDSIRRNLTYSMPDLLQRIQAAPASLNANFRLYRNLDTLCDTFSSFVESAEAFGTRDQYEPLAADLTQLDRLRRQLGDRMDMLAGANDAELARLRAQVSTPSGTKPPASKVVINDNDQPKPKKKPKTATTAPAAKQAQPAK